MAVEGGGMNAAAGVFFESSNSNGRKSVGWRKCMFVSRSQSFLVAKVHVCF